jgi:hypothetical protein
MLIVFIFGQTTMKDLFMTEKERERKWGGATHKITRQREATASKENRLSV